MVCSILWSVGKPEIEQGLLLLATHTGEEEACSCHCCTDGFSLAVASKTGILGRALTRNKAVRRHL